MANGEECGTPETVIPGMVPMAATLSEAFAFIFLASHIDIYIYIQYIYIYIYISVFEYRHWYFAFPYIHRSWTYIVSYLPIHTHTVCTRICAHTEICIIHIYIYMYIYAYVCVCARMKIGEG